MKEFNEELSQKNNPESTGFFTKVRLLGWFGVMFRDEKIKVGVFGPVGRMGSDVIKQLKNDNDFQIINICEKRS